MSRYGYIGLGMMGSAMAENLIRRGSAPVTVHDLDPAAVDAAVSLGAEAGHDMVASTGGEPAALLEAWRSMGQLGALTEQYCALLEISAEHIRGELLTTLETQAGIAGKDLSLALELGCTRPGAEAVLDAVRAAMPAVYNVHRTSEEPA